MSQPMRDYARVRAATLLDRLAYDLNRADKVSDAESIHHLRVAIRRFSQCLRVFGQFFPKSKARRIRRKLRLILRQAGEMRNRDIAMDLFAAAGAAVGSAIGAELRRQRDEAEKTLKASLKAWRRRNLSRKWREDLEL
jgi:CHAD domain-containing protein